MHSALCSDTFVTSLASASTDPRGRSRAGPQRPVAPQHEPHRCRHSQACQKHALPAADELGHTRHLICEQAERHAGQAGPGCLLPALCEHVRDPVPGGRRQTPVPLTCRVCCPSGRAHRTSRRTLQIPTGFPGHHHYHVPQHFIGHARSHALLPATGGPRPAAPPVPARDLVHPTVCVTHQRQNRTVRHGLLRQGPDGRRGFPAPPAALAVHATRGLRWYAHAPLTLRVRYAGARSRCTWRRLRPAGDDPRDRPCRYLAPSPGPDPASWRAGRRHHPTSPRAPSPDHGQA